jgi:hypothetical protein
MNTVHLVEITDTDTSEMWSHVLHVATDPAAFLAQEFAYAGPVVEETTKEGHSVRRFTITTREGDYTADVFETPVEMPRVGAV